MNKLVLRQSLILFLTAVIWGVAFVAQSVGMDYVGPFTFSAVRNVIGGLVLLPCIGLLNKLNGKETHQEDKEDKRTLLIGGGCCGILLCIACNLQQFGIMYTTTGKAGFITAMYIVIVPLLGVFMHKKIGMRIWIGVGIAVVGMYLLCGLGENAALQKGDWLLIGCAVCFSFHILTIDYFSPKVDGVKLSCIQFFTCAILSAICMLIWEEPSISAILTAWMPILYAGVLSCGVAYTLQIIGQKGMDPTVASLILSLESVVSLIAGWLILGQRLSNRELLGCALAFAAIILVQIPAKSK